METFTAVSHCRICGSDELQPILSLGLQCLTGVFPRSLEESVTRGPLDLVRCSGSPQACGLVQLRHTYDATEMYGPSYGYRSSLNSSMVSHLRRKVADLSARAGLQDGDTVLDIGSNDGTTLSFYRHTVARFGMDPTAAKFRDYYADGCAVIPDFFSAPAFDAAAGGAKAQIVTSIAMLYDLANPLAFARQVESVLADDGLWHFEQSYLPSMLAVTGYDTICHEHVEYYALSQIEWIVSRAGLRIVDVSLNNVNGGSFAVTACKTSSRRYSRSPDVDRILSEESLLGLGEQTPFRSFAERVERHRGALTDLLATLKAAGSLVLGYGASTKGNVILQYCGIGTELLPFFAEVNADKFGAFTPGSMIPIIPESEARAMRPEYLLAMPWHFRDNLLARETSYIQSGGRMIFPLPEIEVVGGPPV